MEALDIRTLVEERSYPLPVSSPELHDKLSKLVVLIRVPVSLSVLRILGRSKLIDVLLLHRIFWLNQLCRVCVLCNPETSTFGGGFEFSNGLFQVDFFLLAS